MDSTSQEPVTSSQINQGTSLSSFMDAIALEEQRFEQSLSSLEIWSKQFADAQEAEIKAAVENTTEWAAQVNEILKGEKNSVASVSKMEELNSKGSNDQWESQLQPQSLQFSISKSGSTSRFPYPEVQKELRMYLPGDHMSKRDLGNFNSYKDRQGSRHTENVCPSMDRRSHSHRRSPSLEARWTRERRSPSRCEPQRYCHEDFYSPRYGRFRCLYDDSRGRNYRRTSRGPNDASISHHRRSVDSRKQRERRDASPLEVYSSHDSSKHRERRVSSPSGIARSHDSRKHRKRSASPIEVSRNHDSRKHRERRDASPSTISRSRKSRDYTDEKISDATGKRSRYESKEIVHGNNQNYATSERLNTKAHA